MASHSDRADKSNVLLFGLGAIGGFYAFILGRCANVSLSVVARSNFESVHEEGLRIESLNHGNHRVNFEGVYKTPADAGKTFDYIVCTNKATNPNAVPPLFRTVVNDGTTFVVIQNGVGNEEVFREAFPKNTILSCVIWVHAMLPEPNLVMHMKPEHTELGLHRNATVPEHLEQDRLQRFADLLEDGGTNFTVVDDIQVKRWEKVVWNVAWNPITTLTAVDTQAWLTRDEARVMTRRLWREVIDVGRAAGVALRYELVDELMERILAMPPISSSMATDARAGRPLELDVIVGVPMRKARELGVDAPTLAAVFALTEAVHGRLSAGGRVAVTLQ